MSDHQDIQSSPLYRCWCKGTKNEDTQLRYSQNWLFARRAQFNIFNDRVKCGDWEIRFGNVKNAVVYKTRQWFIPVQILELSTNDDCFRFGFNPWAKPVKHLPITYSEQKVRLKYSTFSIAIRVGLLILLVYEGWKHLR